MRVDIALDGVALRAEALAGPRAVEGGVLLRGAEVAVAPPWPAIRFYRHGWQSWSPTWWVDATARPAASPIPELWVIGDDPAHSEAPRHGGSGIGALASDDGRVLLLGALVLDGRVEVSEAGGLRGAYEGGQGDWFVALGAESDVFARYAARLGERFGAPKQPTPRVWCSWYAFFGNITEGLLLEVLGDLDGLAFDVFQVDDGWQAEIGDWQAGAGFSAGMGTFAARVRQAGYRPGLWLAPFIAHERSRTFAAHPEWFVRDAQGAPLVAGVNWGGRFHALDMTHPGARDHVTEVIAAVTGWGYDYLKLDFVYAAALPGRRHADVGREQAYRSGAELVREATGDDTYLLACGAPVLASLGVFDGLRVGPDVAPWWDAELATRHLRAVSSPNTRFAIITSLHRLWLQPVIDTDPDVVYFRTRYNLLDPAERRWLRDLATVAAFKATSDPPAWLDAGERAALAAFLADDAEVTRTGPHRFTIAGREVDFSPVAHPDPDPLSV